MGLRGGLVSIVKSIIAAVGATKEQLKVVVCTS